MIVLCTSCKPVIRLSILAEKEPVKNLEGMHGEEKNMGLGSDRIEAFPLFVPCSTHSSCQGALQGAWSQPTKLSTYLIFITCPKLLSKCIYTDA